MDIKNQELFDSYSTFELIDLPPVSKLKMFASNKKMSLIEPQNAILN